MARQPLPWPGAARWGLDPYRPRWPCRRRRRARPRRREGKEPRSNVERQPERANRAALHPRYAGFEPVQRESQRQAEAEQQGCKQAGADPRGDQSGFPTEVAGKGQRSDGCPGQAKDQPLGGPVERSPCAKGRVQQAQQGAGDCAQDQDAHHARSGERGRQAGDQRHQAHGTPRAAAQSHQADAGTSHDMQSHPVEIDGPMVRPKSAGPSTADHDPPPGDMARRLSL